MITVHCDQRIDQILDLLELVELRLKEIEKELGQIDFEIERLDKSFFKKIMSGFQSKISKLVEKHTLLKSERYNLENQKKIFKELLLCFS